jgi:tRNA-splicing ligase RtcB
MPQLLDNNAGVLCFLDPQSIDPNAQQQLRNTASMPFVYRNIAVMPDCHLGMGATVGSVIATQGAIIPAAVGVDIGCGMIAVLTSLWASDLPDSLKAIREGIERRIPLGAGVANTTLEPDAKMKYDKLCDSKYYDRDRDYSKIAKRWHLQLGTLGSGNHFIELCLDEMDRVWVVLHSGSRGIGNKLAQLHIDRAKGLMKEMFISLPDRDLAYLVQGTADFRAYIKDLMWAQEYAKANREEMMDRVMEELNLHFRWNRKFGREDALEVARIQCHHNFTQQENHFGENVWVTRKGAIQAQHGQLGIIPGSMGTRSYIVSGLGCTSSFNSAPHGAGRRFSRTEARRRFTMQDFDEAMKGIEHRRTDALIDELPGAYKDIDEVMENAKELVEIEHTLCQVLNVKGD